VSVVYVHHRFQRPCLISVQKQHPRGETGPEPAANGPHRRPEHAECCVAPARVRGFSTACPSLTTTILPARYPDSSVSLQPVGTAPSPASAPEASPCRPPRCARPESRKVPERNRDDAPSRHRRRRPSAQPSS